MRYMSKNVKILIGLFAFPLLMFLGSSPALAFQLTWPLPLPYPDDPSSNHNITQGYSGGHTAYDYDTPDGADENVYSTGFGTVTAAVEDKPRSVGCDNCPANYVKISHSSGYETWYWHLKQWSIPNFIDVGDAIAQGQKIGQENCSGICSGDHLHFEVRKNGSPVNPYSPNIWYSGTEKIRESLADIATFYDYGSCTTKIHAFLSTGASFAYQGADGWWASNPGSFCASSIKATASGDFDGDGDEDTATFYDYGSGNTGIWTFLSSGGSFTSSYWWPSTYFPASDIKYALGGDFNEDGKDDIAVLHGSGSNTTVYVFISSGSSFSRQNWWSSSGYSLSSTYGAGSSDYDGDGDSDLAVFYKYTASETRIHVFLSMGTYFYYPSNYGWWRGTSYPADGIAKTVAGKFNNDAYGDIANFYDYGGGEARIWNFVSTGTAFTPSSWWYTPSGYSLSNVPYALSGPFNNTYESPLQDVATIYDYPGSETRIHVWLSTGSAFAYQGANGWWSVGSGYDTTGIKGAASGRFGRE